MTANFAQPRNRIFSAAPPISPAEVSGGNGGFPALFSDEEFEQVQLRRHDSAERPEHERQDNAGIRAKPVATDGRPESTLEQRFGHVAKQLAAMWPSDACAMYIKRLVISDRESRQGFPQDVVDDLLMLYQLNELHCRTTRAASGPSGRDAGALQRLQPTNTAFDWNAIPDKGYKHG